MGEVWQQHGPIGSFNLDPAMKLLSLLATHHIGTKFRLVKRHLIRKMSQIAVMQCST